MKTRSSFISNSSSSSFLVSNANKGYVKVDWPEVLVVNKHFGTYEFGWGPQDIHDIGSRVIFAYIQTQYKSSKPEWFEMLETVIKRRSHVTRIEWRIDNYYIDHQSSADEGRNTQIFEGISQLTDFIFGKDSYIALRNDNEDYDED